MRDRIREKIDHLVRLADRPGTPEEGEAAQRAAIRLSLKYGIRCKFTEGGTKPTSTRPTASTPPPERPHNGGQSPDAIFYQWVRSLADLGWLIYETAETKIGQQIKFRHPDFPSSEIVVTQRKFDGGTDFEAEHIKNPDPDRYGKDWSYSTFFTVSLKELLRHLAYTKK